MTGSCKNNKKKSTWVIWKHNITKCVGKSYNLLSKKFISLNIKKETSLYIKASGLKAADHNFYPMKLKREEQIKPKERK